MLNTTPLVVGDSRRRAVVSNVARLLEETQSPGRRVIATILGDAGHGKSTVLQEIADRLARSGRTVVGLRGASPDNEIPYASIHGLLTRSPGEPRGSRRPEVAGLESAARPVSPLAVASSLEGWLSDQSPTRPLVVTVDDADLVDEDSLRVLAFTASRLPPGRLSIVATLTRPVPLIDRIGPVRFELDDLDRHDALAVTVSFGVSPIDAGRIVDRLGGNPLALRHTGESVFVGALEPGDDEPLPLAQRLALFLEQRIDTLAPITIRLLETSAVTREVRIDVLDGWSRARGDGPVDDMIGAAEDAGLVDGDASVLRWRRAWMIEGMVARCPPGRRRRTKDRWRAITPVSDSAMSTPSEAPKNMRRLSQAEMRVVEVVVNGASTKTAANELHLSEKTVESHLQNVFRKLGVHSRVQLAALVRSADGDGLALPRGADPP